MPLDRIRRGDAIARHLQRQTGGRWAVWYGHTTGRLWAVCRGGYWPGLVEAGTAAEMMMRIGEVDAWYLGPRCAMRRTATGAWAA